MSAKDSVYIKYKDVVKKNYPVSPTPKPVSRTEKDDANRTSDTKERVPDGVGDGNFG